MIDVKVEDSGLNIDVTIEGSGPPGKPGADGISPTVDVVETENGHTVTITDKGGAKSFEVTNGRDGTDGTDGKSPYVGENGHWFEWQDGEYVDTGKVAEGQNGNDGISPTVEVTQTGTGHKVVITDKDGAKSFDVSNGQNGEDGEDGVSPTITVDDIDGGHKVTIVTATGSQEFTILNGKDGGDGLTPNISIGTVETLPAGSNATAEITGVTPNLTLNMGIPQGREGPAGLGLPTPTPEDAGKFPMVNPEGDGYIFGKLSEKRRLIAKYTHTANGVVKLSDLDMKTGVFTCSEPHKLSEGKPMYLRPLSGCNPVNIPVEIPLANLGQWGRGRLKAHIVDDYSFKLYKESSDDCLTYTSEYNSRVNVDFFTFEFDLKSVRISNVNCNSIEIYACGDVSGGYFGSAFHLVGLQGSKEEIVRITEEDSAAKSGSFLDGREGQVSKSLVFVGKATFKDDSVYAIFDYMSHVVELTSYAKQPSSSAYIRRARASTSKTVGLTNYRMHRVPGEKVDIITGFSPCSSEAIPYNGFYIEVWGYDDDK